LTKDPYYNHCSYYTVKPSVVLTKHTKNRDFYTLKTLNWQFRTKT